LPENIAREYYLSTLSEADQEEYGYEDITPELLDKLYEGYMEGVPAGKRFDSHGEFKRHILSDSKMKELEDQIQRKLEKAEAERKK
jgi:hypothetical protein